MGRALFFAVLLGFGLNISRHHFLNSLTADDVFHEGVDLQDAILDGSRSPDSLGYAFESILRENEDNNQRETLPLPNIEELSWQHYYPELAAMSELADQPEAFVREVTRQISTLGVYEISARLQLIREVYAIRDQGFDDEAFKLILDEIDWISRQQLPDNLETFDYFSGLIKIAEGLGSADEIIEIKATLIDESKQYSSLRNFRQSLEKISQVQEDRD